MATPKAWGQLSAQAGAQYHGDGLSVIPMAGGARLRCVFQRLDGEATREGLWLTSTTTTPSQSGDRFRVLAVAVQREQTSGSPLNRTGEISVAGPTVKLSRPGLVEEYSVSLDGVRQDFVLTQKPAGPGELRVQLEVDGAAVATAAGGVKLVLAHSGRQIAYDRLRATDAQGRELPARLETFPHGSPAGENGSADARGSDARLILTVDDAKAAYPVRIDPTFSDANWESMGGRPGANNTIAAAVADGAGNLYLGGAFTAMGTTNANYVVQWNGSRWLPLGTGVDGDVWSLAVSGTNLYAGGKFTNAGGAAATRIAQWNGARWSPLGSGMDNTVAALAVSGGIVYAGGYFTTAGGNAVNSIAQWNGTNWAPLGTGMSGGSSLVAALAASDTNLYAGGSFTTAGGSPANNIAQWNGANWTPLGAGMTGGGAPSVWALAASGTNLYAGGDFTMAGSRAASNIAYWNGASWAPLGAGVNGNISALAILGTNLYAGGGFSQAGGNPATGMAQWNGSAWFSMGPILTLSSASALAIYAGRLLAVGNFWAAEPDNVAQWNGTNWLPLDAAIDNPVSALAVDGNDLYVSGGFTTAGGKLVNHIAKWDGANWLPLRSGLNGGAAALALMGANLYAGGSFGTAGGLPANNTACWNGSTWSPLGAGVGGGMNVSSPFVAALAVSGTTLFVGGEFDTDGGAAANSIAQWDGTNWWPLGSGMTAANNDYPPPKVNALLVSGGTLYAGGYFTEAGSASANNLAAWNGAGWSALGPGVNNTVYALAGSSTNLYVGGSFSTAGGIPANCIAQWNGLNWSPLGTGMNGDVYALDLSDNTLYAGGGFTTAGGSAAHYIAQWNGSNWAPLGSGLDQGTEYYTNVLALAIWNQTLFAGGTFTLAGGKISGYLAAAVLGPPTILAQPQNTNVLAGGDALFTASAGDFPMSSQWFKNGNGLADGVLLSGGIATTALTLKDVGATDPGYYQVVITNIGGSATSCVASLTVSNLPFTMVGASGQANSTNQQFALTLAGPVGSNVVIYTSTNLSTWAPLATNPLALGAFTFTDAPAAGPQRFYHAALTP
jgi:hypothetical protein